MIRNGSPAAKKLGRGCSPKPRRAGANTRATEAHARTTSARRGVAPPPRRLRSEPLAQDGSGSALYDPDPLALSPLRLSPITLSWAQRIRLAAATPRSAGHPQPQQPAASLSYADVAKISNGRPPQLPQLPQLPPPWPMQPSKGDGAAAGERAPAAAARPVSEAENDADGSRTLMEVPNPRQTLTRTRLEELDESTDGGVLLADNDFQADVALESSSSVADTASHDMPASTLKFMFSDADSDKVDATSGDEQSLPIATVDGIFQSPPSSQGKPEPCKFYLSSREEAQCLGSGWPPCSRFASEPDQAVADSENISRRSSSSSSSSRSRSSRSMLCEPTIRPHVVLDNTLSSVLGQRTIFAGGMKPSQDTYAASWPEIHEFLEQTDGKLPRPRWPQVGYDTDCAVKHRGEEIIPDRWHWRQLPADVSRQPAFNIMLEETHGPMQSLLDYIDNEGGDV